MTHPAWRALALAAALGLTPAFALAQAAPQIKSVGERKVAELPAGELFWQIDHFPSRAQAEAAASAHGVVAEAAGKVWLFTLGAKGAPVPAGATRVSEVGPVARVQARQYLLRINDVTGAPGTVTSVHSHPGSEAFYVLKGEQTVRGPKGVIKVRPGQAEPGLGADEPVQVSSTGTEDLQALVMFLVDAERPFSSPAKLP